MSAAVTMQDVHDYLEECVKVSGTFYLATVDGERPECRPVSFHMFVEGQEYFGVGTHKAAFKQIEANPNVQIVGCQGAGWIRMSGCAVMDEDPGLFEKALEVMPFLASIYNEESGLKMGFFHLENGSAVFVERMMNVERVLEF